MHYDLTVQLLILHESLERICLLNHPRLIGHIGGWRDIDLSRLDVKKDKNEDVTKTRLGHDFFREEVTLLHGSGVTFDELIPSTRTAFRTDVKPVSLEEVLDGVAGHGFNAKFLEFTENPTVAPACLLCQFQNEFLDVLSRSRSSRSCFFAVSILGMDFTNPSTNCSGMNNGCKFIQS